MKPLFTLLLLSICSLTQAALTLTKTVPADGTTGISLTTKIVLQFSEDVSIGTGGCQLNGSSLAPTIASKYVTFSPSGLEYLTLNTFVIPAGAFVSRATNEPFAGVTFRFTTLPKPQPTAKLFDAIVAADGSGQFTKVQAAINAMPDNRTQPWLIFVKNGVYDELLRVPASKSHLHLIGQDKEKTVIQYKINCASNPGDLGWEFSGNKMGIADGSSVVVEAPDFHTENISYINTWGYGQKSGPQALALITRGDRVIVNNCKLLSYQDTWMTTSNGLYRAYVRKSFIEGAVDFIYNSGDYYFDSCTLNINRTTGGYIVAPSHDASAKWGYIFMNCQITAPTTTAVYLGRPWHNAPKTSFVNTTLGKNLSVYPTGWVEKMGGIPAIFADYNTMNYQGVPVDLSQRNNYYWYTDSNTGLKVEGYAQKTLTPEQVAGYTIRNVLNGSDGWHPDELITSLPAPNLRRLNDQLSWSPIPYAICYVLTRNDSTIAFTKDTTLMMDQPGRYALQSVNEYGVLSTASASMTKFSSKVSSMPIEKHAAWMEGNTLHVLPTWLNAEVQCIALTGKVVYETKLQGTTFLRLPKMPSCLVRVTDAQKTQVLKYLSN